MSFGHSTSVDRDTLREQQRKARAQLADIKDVTSAHPLGLFGEPIKVAPSSDDPLGKRIKKTLGEYDAMKETISSNPKNLIGITRQPPTPLPTQPHHEPPSFARPHNHQQQQQHNGGGGSRQRRSGEVRSHSSSRSNRDVESRHQSHHSRAPSSGSGSVVFARPKSVSLSSKPQSSQSDSNHLVSSSAAKPTTGSKSSSSSSTARDTTSSPAPLRERSASQVQHRQHLYPSLTSKHSHATNTSEQRPNGSVKANNPRGSSSSAGVKPNLKLKIDSQVKHEESVGAEVEDILKEMIAPTPLSGIPTPRKQESKFPFPNAANEMINVHTVAHTKAKSVCRSLDLSSCLPLAERAPPGTTAPPPLSAGILKEDLAISEDSDDEVGSASKRGPAAPNFATSCGTAVLTNPPPPLAAMSPNSESSSSDSEGSSSGSDSEENSNRSHESEASDDESRPQSPKPDQIWNLDNFIKSTSQSVPFGLPSDPPVVHDQESQSYDAGLCTPIKGSVHDDDGGFCSVPDILSKDFSKEDIKNLIPSPPPEPLGSIDDFCVESGELISKAMEGVPPMSSPMSPSPPHRPTKSLSKKQQQHQQQASVGHAHSKKATLSSSSFTSSLLDKAVKKHTSSKHVKDVFVKKNGLINDRVASSSVNDGQKNSSSQKSAVEAAKIRSGGDKRRDLFEVASKKKDSLSAVYKKSRCSGSSSKNSDRISKCDDVDISAKNRSSESPAYQRRPPSPQGSSSKAATHQGSSSRVDVAPPSKATTPSNSTVSKSFVSSTLSKSEKKVLSASQSFVSKKVAQDKKSRSHQPQKFKSKEYISDTGDSSDSESEIVDVVGTPSPVKICANGKAAKNGISNANTSNVTATIAAVSTGASSKSLTNGGASPLCKKKSTSKHLLSKSKDLSISSSSISSSASSCDGASVSHVKRPKSPKKSPFASSEYLSTKTAPLSPIRDKLSSTGSQAKKSLSSSGATLTAGSTVIVKLEIALLERVPPYPPIGRVIGSSVSALSSSRVAIQTGSARSEGKTSAGTVLDDGISADVPPTQYKLKQESKSTKRRNSNGDSRNSDKKRRFKVSAEDMGSNSSLSSTSSVKGVHKSRSSKVMAVTTESNDSLIGKSASIEQRVGGTVSEVLLGSTEDASGLVVSRGTGSSENKVSLKDKNVEVSKEVEKEMPTPARSSRDREIQLPTRDEPPVIAQMESDYNRSVNREGSLSSILSQDDAIAGGDMLNFEADSQISSNQSSGEPSGKPKNRIKDNTEPDFKRRKADIPVSSQTCPKWEPPKSSNIDSIERNTNHDRILPVARVRPNTDCITNPKRKCIELNEKLSSPYYLDEAVKLKHEADKETDRTKQTMLYLEAVLYFILTGEAMEREHLKEHIVYQMFRKTVDLIKYVATNNKFRGHQTTLLNENISTRLSVLSLRCQSLLHLKLFNMKKKDFHECQRFLSEHQKSSSGRSTMTSPQQSSSMMLNNAGLSTATVWNQRSTGTPSPMSPLPSPAGSVGSVESQSSGYSSPKLGPQGAKLCNGTTPSVVMPPMSHLQSQSPATVTIPANLHSAMLQQLSNYQHLLSCHEMWDQADIATVRGRSEEFFAALDQQYGKLTLHSSLRELVRYVQHGLYPLKGNT